MNVMIVSSLIQGLTVLASEYIRHKPSQSSPVTASNMEKLILEDIPQAEAEKIPEMIPQMYRDNDKVIIVEESPIISKDKGNKATAIATGCIPCSLGHVGTCTGLMKEAIRFAKSPEGVGSIEVIDRVNMCLDELNSMERVDMRPEMIRQLPEWEHELAQDVLDTSRALRHKLENVENFDKLEEIAATLETKRKQIGRDWFKAKLANLTDADKAAVTTKIVEKINEMQEQTPEE
jgi:hypothetical protein